VGSLESALTTEVVRSALATGTIRTSSGHRDN
jgi:hypothetical protein